MVQDSIFTKIIKGDIPSHKIYEDDKIIAFLDIFPVVSGQTVVVPKKQIEFVWDLENTDYQLLMIATKNIARHLRKKLKTKFVGIKIEGVEVPHAHVKVYPFNTVDEYNAEPNTSNEPDHDNLARLAVTLKMENI